MLYFKKNFQFIYYKVCKFNYIIVVHLFIIGYKNGDKNII